MRETVCLCVSGSLTLTHFPMALHRSPDSLARSKQQVAKKSTSTFIAPPAAVSRPPGPGDTLAAGPRPLLSHPTPSPATPAVVVPTNNSR